MSTALAAGETFERAGVPAPHQEGHCESTLVENVVYLECKCGYAGFAREDANTGKPVCPAHQARVEAYNREQNLKVNEVTQDKVAVDALVADAVAKVRAENAKAIQSLSDQVAQLTALLTKKQEGGQ